MKRTAMLLAGGLISGVLVGGPAQASGSDDLNVSDACGDEFVLVGLTTITGPAGRASSGRIVQATDPLTGGACTFVVLAKDRGTTGTLTVGVQAAAASTPSGTWNEWADSVDEIDLDDEFVSDPMYVMYPDATRAVVTVGISGTALQGGYRRPKEVAVVPATKAEKKAAKAAFRKSVKAARKSLAKHQDQKRFKRAVKRARDRRDDKLDGHRKHVVVKVGVPTPFTATAIRSFDLVLPV